MKRTLDHSKPIVLEENMSYYIASGALNLFLVKQSENPAIEHKRHFLTSVEEGTTIIGSKATLDHGHYQFVIVSNGLAGVQAFPSGKMEVGNESVIKWLTCLNTHTDREQLRIFSELSSDELVTIAKQNTFHYLHAKAEDIHLENILKKNHYIERKRNEAALIDEVVQMFKNDELNRIFQQPGSILFKACQVAAKELDVVITEPKPFDENQQEPLIMMKTYFQKTNMKYRKVTLSGSWWKHIDGVLIAFKANKQPVVLLPSGKSHYEMIDMMRGTSEIVNGKTASCLLGDAFMMYRSLPEERIQARDLLNFGIKRISKKDYLLFSLCIIGIGLLGMVSPILTGLVVDSIIPQGDLNLLSQMGIMLAVVALTTLLFDLTRGFILLRIEGKLDVDLQAAVWDRLLHLPLGFFKQFTSAELTSRALGITMIRDVVSGPGIAMLLMGIYALFSWLVLFYFHIPLAIIVSLMTSVCIAVNYFMAKKVLVSEYKINELTNSMSGLTFQLIKGAIKIQHSGAVERAYYKWGKEQAKKHKAVQNKGIMVSKMEAFNGLYLPISMAIIYYLITMQPAFYLPVGHFIGFNAAYMMFAAAIFSIFSSMHMLFQVMPLYARGKIILETKPECILEKKILEEPTGKISVDHVQFQYNPEGPKILKDVSLEIKSGEYIGIVGTSGSGKSTLLRLMLGFEALENGTISYDGKDINNLDLRELRKRIGVVLQSGKLMTDSIYHNIVGTHLHLTMEDAWMAAKVAGIDEDIKEMPMGMHTLVMEGAGTISGGQKQRILIARAVVNKPRILFFDEATSALDNITQAKIKQSLDQFSATRIVIAHRLSTVKNCDRIIVLDYGEVKEVGSYEALMNKKGVFYEIAKRQLV